MKTSIAKKLRDRLLAAFLAIAVMLSCVVPSAITASAAQADTPTFDGGKYGSPKHTIDDGFGAGVEFKDFSVKIPDPDHPGQYKELNEGDIVSKDTEFQLSLKWHFADTVKEDEVVKEGFPLVMHFDLSGKMKFLELLDTESEFIYGDDDSGTVMQYFFNGTDLWIVVWDDNGQTQGFHGAANLKAKLNAEKKDTNEDGELTVEFFDKHIQVPVEEFLPALSVEKTAGEIVSENGKFYQPFTVTVTSPKDANNVTIKDSFNVGGFYKNAEMHDLKVGGEAAKFDSEGNIVIDHMDKNVSVKVTYSLEIDPAKSSNDNGSNTVEASSEDVAKPGTASITPSYTAPYVGKNGTVSADRKTIKWTITYEPKDLEKIEGVDCSNFVIKDIPGAGSAFTEDLIKGLEAKGATYDAATGTLTIPGSLMTKENEWSPYTLTYETEIDESVQESVSDTVVSNDAQVTYPEEEKLKDVQVNGHGTVTIEGIDDSYVEKDLEKTEGSTLSWNTKVKIPDADLDTLTVSDNVTNYTNYQRQQIVKDSVKITYNGKEFSPFTLDTEGNEVKDTRVQSYYFADGSFSIEFTKEFIDELRKGKIRDLEFTYKTLAVDDEGNQTEVKDTLTLENSFSFTAKLTETESTISKNGKYTKSPKFGGSKVNNDTEAAKHIAPYDEGTFPQTWAITIDNSKDETFFPADGDVIKIVDVLPEGCEFTDDSWIISVGDDQWNNKDWWSGDSYKDNVKIDKQTLDNGRQQLTVSITVTDDMYKNIIQYIDPDPHGWNTHNRTKWAVTFHYATHMTQEAASKLFDDFINGGSNYISLINKADLYYNDDEAVSVEATGSLLLNSQDELDKYTLLEGMTKAPQDSNDNGELAHIFHDDGGNYILYRLVINKDGLYLGGLKEDGTPNIEKLTAVDKLGTSLKFGGIVSGYEGEPEQDGQTITFTLENGKAYEIVYKAYITRVDNVTEVTPEQAKESFNNQVSLEGVTTLKLDKDSMISASVYKANYSGGATTQEATVEINGTKVWKNDSKDKRPNSITITVEKKDSKGDTIETTPYIYDSTKQDPANGFTVNGNEWSFKITGLVSKTEDGQVFTYNITEVEVDGYKTTYDGENIGIGNTSGKRIVDLTIINDGELTSLNVNKVWATNIEKYGLSKQAVTVYLTVNGEKTGNSVVLNEDNSWTGTFTDLPKYDAAGNVIEYSAEEDVPKNFKAEVMTDKTTGNVTITNNVDYSKFKTSISGVKTWSDFDDKFGKRPDSVTIKLLQNGLYTGVYCETDASKNWEYSFDDLDDRDPLTGKTIVYTVEEADVDYYTSTVEGSNITNTLKTAKVTIKKVDEEGEPLAGAALKLLDSNGEMVYEWNTADSNPNIVELIPGEKYTLVEETAPNGYDKADSITFTVNEDGTVTIDGDTASKADLVMTDKKTPDQPIEPKTADVTISKKDITDKKELANAKLKVVLDKDGTTVDSWTSGTAAHVIKDLVVGETYTLIEETAPDGYVKAKNITFTVNEDGTVTIDGKTFGMVEMLDDTTKVQISKKDITGDEELEGAKLQVKDSSGKVVDEWVSGTEPHDINGKLKAGETYTLHEEAAPDGYAYASDVEFTVNEDGSVTQVVMKDDVTKVQISKQDMTTGKEVKGAKLKVVDKDGNVIKEWTSTDTPEYFENVFKAGETYTLIEETAPDGYVVAEKVEFTVSMDGSIDRVVMKDDVTKVSISKKDITGDGELAGAKLQVLDKDGKVVDEWTSTDKPHEINGVLKAGETYTLHEEAAPDGYVVANDIKFVVNADGTVTKVTMIDEAKSGTDLDNDSNDRDSGVAQGGGSNDKDNDSPKTGDSSNITPVMLALALGVMTLIRKKRRNI